LGHRGTIIKRGRVGRRAVREPHGLPFDKLPKNFWRMPRAEDRQGLVLKALLEEREEGR